MSNRTDNLELCSDGLPFLNRARIGVRGILTGILLLVGGSFGASAGDCTTCLRVGPTVIKICRSECGLPSIGAKACKSFDPCEGGGTFGTVQASGWTVTGSPEYKLVSSDPIENTAAFRCTEENPQEGTVTITAKSDFGKTLSASIKFVFDEDCGCETGGCPTQRKSQASPPSERVTAASPMTLDGHPLSVSPTSESIPRTGSSLSGSVRAQANGVSIAVPLGRVEGTGISAGSLSIHEMSPGSGLSLPECLKYNTATNTYCQMILNGGGTYICQMKMPEGLVDVQKTNNIKYWLNFYTPTNVGAFTNGIYRLTGSPYSTVLVENPDASGSTTDKLKITDGNGKVYNYTYYTNGWKLTIPGSVANQISYTTGTNGTETVRTEIWDATTNLISYKSQTYQTSSVSRLLIESVVGTGLAARTNTVSYGTNSTGGWRLAVNADGSWEQSEHNAFGVVTNIYSSFGNQGPTNVESLCRRVTYDYSDSVVSGSGNDTNAAPFAPRLVVEKVLGQEIARTYYVYLLGEARVIRAANPGGSWNDSSNLVTITKFISDNGTFQGRPISVSNPDGTLRLYSYSVGASNWTTTTILTGQPDANGTNVVQGTKRTILTGTVGQSISDVTIDIFSGLTVDSQSYSDFDAQQRPRKVTYLDGTFTWTDYGCCGPVTITNRNGLVTQYQQDAAGRQIAIVENLITRTNVLGADGLVRVSQRVGTPPFLSP